MTPPLPKSNAPTEMKAETLFHTALSSVDLEHFKHQVHPGDVPSYFSKPLPCLRGEKRPPLVSEYVGPGVCGIKQAKDSYQLAFQAYDQGCIRVAEELKKRIFQKIQNRKTLNTEEADFYKKSNIRISTGLMEMKVVNPLADRSLSFPSNPLYRYQTTTCGEAETSIPAVLDQFGLLDPGSVHPFFNFIYELNVDQLHDFRSGESFIKAADIIETELKKNRQRSLIISYPAAGSHIAPLVIAFRLIDNGSLDTATFNFSEIDENSPKRILGYLQGLANMPANPEKPDEPRLITGLIHWKVQKKKGYEEIFSFRYQGKPITLRVGIKRSDDKYLADSYLQNTQLLILHDMTNYAEERRLVNSLARFQHQRKSSAPSWVLGDVGQKEFESLGEEIIFKGKFGCGGVQISGEFFYDKTWSVSKQGADEELVQSARMFLGAEEPRIYLDPYSTSSEFREESFLSHRNGFNLLIHLKQNSIPVHLISIK
jgi:hypothetical protein